MADVLLDGNVRVDYVPTISNINAPTTTEMNAGTRLDTTMDPAGLMGFEADTTNVSNAKLSSSFDTSKPGRIAYQNTALRIFKQSGTDTIFDLLVRNLAGYICVRRGVDADTAWASAQKLEVYPITCGEAKRLTPAPNEYEKYEVPVPVSSEPATRAAIA